MIVGYDDNGSVRSKFKNLAEMQLVLNISESTAIYLVIYCVNHEGIRYYDESDYEKPSYNAFDKEAEAYRKMQMAEAVANEESDMLKNEEIIKERLEDNVSVSQSTFSYCSDEQKDSYFSLRNSKLEELMSGLGASDDEDKGSDFDIDKDPTTPSQGLGGGDGGDYSSTGSSSHYKSSFLEYVDAQERLFGTVGAYIIVQGNVNKYRDRAGKKEGVSLEKDMTKAFWYESCGAYLLEKIEISKSCSKYLDQIFDKEYGRGRSEFIKMPPQLVELFGNEVTQSDIPFGRLEQIVDNKL